MKNHIYNWAKRYLERRGCHIVSSGFTGVVLGYCYAIGTI